MFLLKKFILSVLFLFCGLTLYGAESSVFQNEYLTPLSVVDGLVSNEVNCMLQDSKGYIWYGTNNGLCRYDGYAFKIYKSNYQTPDFFTNNAIRSLAEDQSNKLWIGTLAGLNQIDLSSGEVRRFVHAEFSQSSVNSIVISDDNTPYIGTNNGLYFYDSEADNFVRITHDNKGNAIDLNDNIRTLYLDSNNYLWIGTWEGGYAVYNMNTNVFVDYPYLQDKDMLIVSGFYEDSEQNMWIATWDRYGVFCIQNPHQPTQSKVTEFQPLKNEKSNFAPVVYAINQDNNTGSVLLATSNGIQIIQQPYKYEGVVQLNRKNATFISSDEIFSLHKDRTGLIWYSIYGYGVNALNSNKVQFKQYNLSGLLDEENFLSSVTGIYEDNQGLLWLGIKSFLLGLYDRDDNSMVLYNNHPVLKKISSRSNAILCFHQPLKKKHELWLGTRYGGLYIVTMKGKEIRAIAYKDIAGIDPKSLNVKRITEDDQNNIWIATNKGIKHMQWNSATNAYEFIDEIVIEKQFENQIVNTIFIDNQRNLWVGTQHMGLFKIPLNRNDKHIVAYNYTNQRLNNDEVLCLLQDHRDRIWVGTKGGGLSLYDEQEDRFNIIDNMSLLQDDAIYAMEQDHWGNIWLATGNGLVSYNQDLPYDQRIRIFSGKEGIIINTFNPNAKLKTNANELFFGGSNGFISFIPEKNTETSFSPKPVITGFSVSNQQLESLSDQTREKISPYDVSYTKQLLLNYNQNNFMIEYSSMLYENTSAVKYAYRLSGVDLDWVYVDSQKRYVNYNNLSSGSYTFEVKAANAHGVWCEQPTVLHIKVKPAPWNTLYAFSAYMVLIIVILSLLSRFFYNRIKLKRMLAIEQIEREKSEEVHQAKLRFFTNISHEFFTPITILNCALDGFSKRYPNEFKVIHTLKANMARLERLLEQLVEFRKIESGDLRLKLTNIEIVSFIKELCDVHFSPLSDQQNITLSFETQQPEILGYVDRDKLDKVMYNLLSNAFKYNKENGTVKVLLRTIESDEGQKLMIKVSDTGHGMSPAVKQHLFKRFYEGNFRNFKVKSFGIGLSLVYDLVKFHKGDISVDSIEDEGTTFVVTLPIEKSFYTDDDIHFNHILEETTVANLEEQAIDSPHYDQLLKEKSRLLIVEDNPDLNSIISESLKADFEIFNAHNGIEAMHILQETDVDIVVTDVLMPQMDGVALTEKMKSDVSFSHIPVLMLSARQSVEHKIEGFDAGADAYVTKPFDTNELIAHIRSLVRNRKLLAQSFASENGFMDVSKYSHNQTDKEFLEKVIQTIEKGVTEKDFSTNDLYFELNMSQSTFYRKLHAMIGLSPKELIRKIKIKVACSLLQDNQLNISEIAYDLGFNDPKYFSNIFKKEMGMTPSEYIKSTVQKNSL